MNFLYKNPHSQSLLHLFSLENTRELHFKNHNYTIIWNRGNAIFVRVNGIPVKIKTHHLLTLTPAHTFEIENMEADLVIFQFNDSFYCVGDHDKEVSCVGIIFYGSTHTGTIQLPETEVQKFNLLLEMFAEEFENQDNIQKEMLTVLLKRLIIKCTRIAKEQHFSGLTEDVNFNLIREFNVLVEFNFRQHHDVSFYAEKLNKSPKTIANSFALFKLPSPLTLIHNRLLLEAQQQLVLSEKSIKEIAYELNFTDLQTFSRFFKNKAGLSPTDFKKSITAFPSGISSNL